jgi:leucyl aminopeptidase
MIRKEKKESVAGSKILLTGDIKKLGAGHLSKKEKDYAMKVHKELKKDLIAIDRLGEWLFIHVIKDEAIEAKRMENCRKAGDVVCSRLNDLKIKQVLIVDVEGRAVETLAFAEGLALSNYQFLKYKKDRKEKLNPLESVGIRSEVLKNKDYEALNILIDAVYKCRTLINEPVSHLNAARLSKEIAKMGEEAGFKVEVLNKARIESLKMGGLLAVNKGSADPPTFSILEYKPGKALNKQPVVLVGKGIVFDTGGLNIKTGNYMETMKCDMSGAAMMASAIYAVARAGLPVHVIGLIPATDNRPSGNAYAPGDVITMFDGTTVEVLNTDAEGRMILADALSYAKKYKPMLVINAATLTGAAARAIGKYGVVAMESKAAVHMARLKESGERVYERIAEFPFWDEYYELIKSDVADLKNIGGQDAGMITAGKFLAHFTDYPFIHLDIAGPAFLEKKDSYRGMGGTGFGVRLLFDFLKNLS